MWAQIHISTDVGLITLGNEDIYFQAQFIAEVESGQDSEMTKRKVKGMEQLPRQ